MTATPFPVPLDPTLKGQWGPVVLDAMEDRYNNGVIARAVNRSGLPDFFGAGLVACVGGVVTVPPTPYDVWIEWGANLGIVTGGQGGVYTFVYELFDAASIPRGRASTYCPPGTPVSASGGGVHFGRCWVGPSEDVRTFTLNGVVAQEAGTSLTAYFLNDASDYASSYIAAVAQ